MARASLKLESGATVTIEGTTVEIRKLLEFYGPAAKERETANPPQPPTRIAAERSLSNSDGKNALHADVLAVVNDIKSCDDAEAIEKGILDKDDQLPRVLLPLYAIYEHLGNAFGLTSGEISRILTELGARVDTANASRILSGTASRYVIGDRVRKPGQPVRYKLSGRGHSFMSRLLGRKESRT
jgi:hypothetical protein